MKERRASRIRSRSRNGRRGNQPTTNHQEQANAAQQPQPAPNAAHHAQSAHSTNQQDMANTSHPRQCRHMKIATTMETFRQSPPRNSPTKDQIETTIDM